MNFMQPTDDKLVNATTETYLLGHRGARAELLENSEIGFAYAHSLRPKLNGVEFDVQLTADNQLVVVHDAHLTRLVGQQQFIHQSTLAELQGLVQSDWGKFYTANNGNFLYQPMLVLQDLLTHLVGFEHIELEVKTHPATNYLALAKAVFAVVSQPAWQQLPITLTSFDTKFLTAWQSIAAAVSQKHLRPKTGLLLQTNRTLASEIAFLPINKQQQTYAVCNLACRLGCSQIGVHFVLISPALVTIAAQYGLTVTAWTVNDVTIAKRLIDWGVKTVITDFPSQFCHIFRE